MNPLQKEIFQAKAKFLKTLKAKAQGKSVHQKNP